ncbi:hypothetical protein KJZ99_08110 [bacterium]|nr:hypothetical protein [bacterium]
MSRDDKIRNIPWTRYWLPWGGQLSVSFSGFPDDPEGSASNLKKFEDLDAFQCLIMLGDPGVGKSTEWKRSIAMKQPEGARVVPIDLEIHTSDDALYGKVFGPRAELTTANDQPIYMFFDSVDTAKDGVLLSIIEELRTRDRSNIKLRIACRSARWNPAWTEQLQSLFGEKATAVMELSALNRRSVAMACAAFGVSSDDFIQVALKKDLVPLATRPVTLLNFLLPLYKRSGEFPNSLAELYRDGCKFLCSKEHHNLTAPGYEADDPIELVRSASRIAAVSLLTDIRTFHPGSHKPNYDVVCLGLDDFMAQGLTKGSFTQAIDTGLFTKVGDYTGWAHSTFAEYLAAEFLKDLPENQLRDILQHPDGKLIPQLHGLAAWLVNLKPEFCRFVLATEPVVLMLADLPILDQQTREKLVDAVLDGYRNRDFRPYGSEADQHAHKLNHSNIAGQLDRYITNEGEDARVRIAAIRMAQSCKVKQIGKPLVAVSLNQSELHEIRIAAINAAVECADSEELRTLLLIARSESGEDPYDDLKASALEAMWPTCLTAKELFELLTPDRFSSRIGHYHHFLSWTLPRSLKREHLVPALNWLARHPGQYGSLGHNRLAQGVFELAWENVEDDSVAEAFANAVAARFEKHLSISEWNEPDKFKDALLANEAHRRKVVRLLIPLCAGSEARTGRLALSFLGNNDPWLLNSDFDWLLSLVQEDRPEAERRLISMLVWHTVDFAIINEVSKVIDVCQRVSELNDEFGNPVNGLELKSDVAQRARERQARNLEHVREEEKRKEQQAARESQIPFLDDILNRTETEDAGFWWLVPYALAHKHPHHSGILFDVRNTDGWRAADIATRARVVAAGLLFLKESDPLIDEWIETNSFPSLALSGRTALTLLAQEQPEELNRFTDAMQLRWIPVILALPPHMAFMDGTDDHEAYNNLLDFAKSSNPTLVADTILRLVRADVVRSKDVIYVERIKACWSDRLADHLLGLLKDSKTPPRAASKLLHILISHGHESATSWAIGAIQDKLPRSQTGKLRLIELVLTLAADTDTVTWSFLQELLNRSRKFARTFALAIGRRFERSDAFTRNWPLSDIAELYLWVTREFPPEQDPEHIGAHSVSNLDNLVSFRNALVTQIANRVSEESIVTLERLHEQCPRQDWIRYVIADTKERLRTATWRPMTPREVSKLIDNASNRYVQSPRQLLDIMIKAMGDIQSEIQHQEYPSVKSLWNQLPDKALRPKDEEDVSDYIARELIKRIVDKRIVVNREVQIRRRMGSESGQKPDIRIEALCQQDLVSVEPMVIYLEVKGCWNPKLLNSMKTQLFDRYMAQNRVRAGLYIVAHFYCDSWDNSDERKKSSAKNGSFENIGAQLRAQAESLASTRDRVELFQLNLRLP